MADIEEEDRSLTGRFKGKVQDVQSGISVALSGASEAGVEKFKGAVEEVNALLPLVSELGYSVDAVGFGIGLVPDVSIQVSGLTQTMDETIYRRILDEPYSAAVARSASSSAARVSNVFSQPRAWPFRDARSGTPSCTKRTSVPPGHAANSIETTSGAGG